MFNKKTFLLSRRKVAVLFVLWVLFVVMHNLLYAIFGVEEAFFFILAVFVVPLYLIISVIVSLLLFKNNFVY